MATKALSISLKISTDGNLNGIFSLDTTENDAININDTSVTGNTVTVPVHPGTPTEIVPTTAGDTYVFLKNTDPTNFIQVRRVVGPADYAKLFPGEFIFLCVYDSMGMQLLANGGACVVEYVTFLKA